MWEIQLECWDVFRDKGQNLGKWENGSHVVPACETTRFAHQRTGSLAVGTLPTLFLRERLSHTTQLRAAGLTSTRIQNTWGDSQRQRFGPSDRKSWLLWSDMKWAIRTLWERLSLLCVLSCSLVLNEKWVQLTFSHLNLHRRRVTTAWGFLCFLNLLEVRALRCYSTPHKFPLTFLSIQYVALGQGDFHFYPYSLSPFLVNSEGKTRLKSQGGLSGDNMAMF